MPPKVDAPSSLSGTRAAPPPVVARTPPAKAESPPAAAPVAPAQTEVAAAPGAAFRSMMVAEIVTASLLLALGVLVIGAALRMGTGWGSDGPESGFVPFWLAIILVLCSAANVAKAVRRPSAERFCARDQLLCVLKVLLPATAMIALTPFIGLYLAGAIYMAVYMRAIGRHSWALSLALPVGLTVLVFFVFEKWFLVPLPKGPIEAWLGY
jgi:putative tricarboxylic transport membrane protein